MKFETCLAFVLEREGGYVNDPDDRGGETNFGITDATADAHFGRNVNVRDLTPVQVASVYRAIWDRGRCEDLPGPLRLVHFDACVNHGVTTAAVLLQRTVGVAADALVGPVTLRATHDFCRDVSGAAGTVAHYLELRRLRYKHLARTPSQAKFLSGWLDRLCHVAVATLLSL